MKYRTIPFVRPRRTTVSSRIPRGGIMNGLEPVLGSGPRTWGPAGPGSGFRGMGAYGGEFPNSSFLSGTAAPTSPPLVPSNGGIPVPTPPAANTSVLVMRPDTTKPPGFPGFFAWLAESNPAAYNYAVGIIPPHLISQTKVLRTGGATLSGLGAIYAGRPYMTRDLNGYKEFAGLGDTTGSAGYINAPTTSAPLIDTTFDAGSVPAPATVAIASTGETTTAPVPTASQTAQLVSALTTAGQAIVTGVNNQTVFNAQLSRAEAGLPPLNTSAYGLTGSGLTSALTDPSTLLIIGVVGVGLFLMTQKKSA